MSDNTSSTDDTARPWHGKDNPMEAMYQWMKAEMAAVHDKLDRVKALVAPVATPAPPAAPKSVIPAPAPVVSEERSAGSAG